MNCMELKDIYKSYGGVHVLSDLSLSVEEGEIYSVLSAKDAGKTTLFQILSGLIDKDAGNANIFGMDCFSKRADIASKAFFLGEIPFFPEQEKPHDYFSMLFSLRKQDAMKRLFEIMELFALPRKTRFKNYNFSEKKLLALAFGISLDAQLMVLDKPFSYIDAAHKKILQSLLCKTKESGNTVFLTIDKMSDGKDISDRLGILKNGMILFEKNSEDLKDERYRVYDISFASAVQAREFSESLEGDFERMGEKVLVLVKASPNALIHRLAQFDVTDITTLSQAQSYAFLKANGGDLF